MTDDERRAVLLDAEVETEHGEGSRQFVFPSALAATDILGIAVPPSEYDAESWNAWDYMVVSRVVELLGITDPLVGRCGQEGDETDRDPTNELTVVLTEVAITRGPLTVGDVYGPRWFSRLPLKEQEAVRAWLRENHLVTSRSEIGLLDQKNEVIVDLRVLEADGMLMATVNRQKERGTPVTRAHQMLGVPPDHIVKILMHYKPDSRPS